MSADLDSLVRLQTNTRLVMQFNDSVTYVDNISLLPARYFPNCSFVEGGGIPILFSHNIFGMIFSTPFFRHDTIVI